MLKNSLESHCRPLRINAFGDPRSRNATHAPTQVIHFPEGVVGGEPVFIPKTGKVEEPKKTRNEKDVWWMYISFSPYKNYLNCLCHVYFISTCQLSSQWKTHLVWCGVLQLADMVGLWHIPVVEEWINRRWFFPYKLNRRFDSASNKRNMSQSVLVSIPGNFHLLQFWMFLFRPGKMLSFTGELVLG